MHLTTYLELLATAESTLAGSYRAVATGHRADADVHYTCGGFADQCAAHAESLRAAVARYASSGAREPEPERLHPPGLTTARSGPVGLLRDLQDLYQLANLVEITWTLVDQAGYGARDEELIGLATRGGRELAAQLAWLRMRMRAAAPQTLLVAG